MPKIELRTRTATYLSGAVVPAGEVVATIETEHSATEVVNLFRVGQVHFMPSQVAGDGGETPSAAIETLGLSQEVNDLLKGANVKTVAQAHAFNEANNGFTVIQGIGPKTNKIIQTVLTAPQ